MGFKKIVENLKLRLKFYRLGIFFLRFKDNKLPPEKLWTSRGVKGLHFPSMDAEKLSWEFGEIIISDCYRLAEFSNVRTIVDIGGHIGLFSIAARLKFPKATIVTYEPNPGVADFIKRNSSSFHFNYIPKAVGLKPGKVLITDSGNTLNAITKDTEAGTIEKVAIDQVISDTGSIIDVLKMDCEGAEWEILASELLLDRVRYITMEYHLWANPSMTHQKMITFFIERDFMIIHHKPLSDGWGMICVCNNRLL